MLEKINQVIDKHIEMYAKFKDSPYKLVKITNNNRQMLFENKVFIESFVDHRVKKNLDACNFCVIYFTDKETNEIIFSTSFIFLNHNQYEHTCFWNFDRENRQLKKQSLIYLLNPKYPELVMTIGFTKNIKNNMRIIQFFLNLVTELIGINVLTFVETTGIVTLNDYLISKSIINLSQEGTEICNNIGKTKNSSITVEKFCKKMGMKELPLIYNLRTLGKVYIST